MYVMRLVVGLNLNKTNMLFITTAMPKIQIYFLDLIRSEFGIPDLDTESIGKWIIKRRAPLENFI